ncbi:hypothetical protein JW905_02025, partial [bacterium]|nr:hypothetical protein [candidate division CSSED10-310 bacterium]
MKNVLIPVMAVLILSGGAATCGAVTNYQLAAHWAPVWRQDTDDTNYRADYITSFNYDGDWVGNNNWDHLDSYLLNAHIYYSIIETGTHWFIMYADFHPRDWENICAILICHENDMEGVLVVIEKTGSTYGQFLLMETEAHNQLYQYSSDSRVGDGHENIDGGVYFEGDHPVVFVECRGHGVFRWDGSDFPGGDGVIYRYTGAAEQPSSGNDRDVGYELLDMVSDLWTRRYNIGNGSTYGSSFTFEGARYSIAGNIGGAFDGDDYSDDSAKPPWNWDDPDDGTVYSGDILIDCAYTIDYHLDVPAPFSLAYTYNPYLGIYPTATPTPTGTPTGSPTKTPTRTPTRSPTRSPTAT